MTTLKSSALYKAKEFNDKVFDMKANSSKSCSSSSFSIDNLLSSTSSTEKTTCQTFPLDFPSTLSTLWNQKTNFLRLPFSLQQGVNMYQFGNIFNQISKCYNVK